MKTRALLILLVAMALASCRRKVPSPVDSGVAATEAPQDASVDVESPVDRWLGDPGAEIDCTAALDAGPTYAAPGEAELWWHLCGVCRTSKAFAAVPRTHVQTGGQPQHDGGIHALTPEESDRLLGEPDLGGIDVWRDRLAPMFPEPSHRMRELVKRKDELFGTWLIDAQVLPSPHTALEKRLPSSEVSSLRSEVTAALHQIFRPEWVEPRGAVQLLALRGAVGGEDAFFGGWTREGKPFQVIVTRKEIFVRTVLDRTCGDQVREQVAAALALATDVFDLPGMPCCATWYSRGFGNLSAGTMPLFAGDGVGSWYQSLKIVTDGHAVKYRFSRVTRDKRASEAPWLLSPVDRAKRH